MWYDDEFLASMYIPYIIYGIPTEPDKIHFDGPCLRINIYNILLLYVLHVWFWKPNLAWCGMIVHADILSLSIYIFYFLLYIRIVCRLRTVHEASRSQKFRLENICYAGFIHDELYWTCIDQVERKKIIFKLNFTETHVDVVVICM